MSLRHLLVLALASCASSTTSSDSIREQAALTVSVAPPTPTASTPVQTVKVRTPTPISALRVPTDAVCVLTLANKAWTRAPAFRLKNDGPSFAVIRALQRARVHVPNDPVGTGVVMQGEVGPVKIAGVGLAAELPIFPEKRVTLGGIFVPYNSTSLRFVGATADSVRIAAPRPPIELTHLRVPLEAEVPCSSASLDWGTERPSVGESLDHAVLIGETIPLSATALGVPLTNLLPTRDGSRHVSILERQASAVRISWELRDGFVTGWVAKTSVKSAKAPDQEAYGTGSGNTRKRGAAPRETKSCDRELSLGVVLDGEAMIVGTIEPQAILDLFAVDGERVAVRVRDAEIGMSDGATLFVSASEIRDCTAVKPAAAR